MKNKILAIAMCTVIIASMLVIPTNAASHSPIPVNTTDVYYSQEFYNSAVTIGYLSGGGDVRICAFQNNTYVYAIPKQTRGDIINYDIYVMTTNLNPNFPGLYKLTYGQNINWAGGPSGHYDTTYDDTTIYWFTISRIGVDQTVTIDTNSPYVKVVNSFEDAEHDLIYGTPLTPIPLSINLYGGNIIVIDITETGNNNYTLTMQNVNAPVQMGYINEIPSTLNVPLTNIGNPNWSPTGKPNIFGQYSQKYTYGNIALENTNNYKYLIIANPIYTTYAGGEYTEVVSDILITIDKANAYYIYPITASYSNGNIIGTTNPNTVITGQPNPDTNSWSQTDTNNQPSDQVIGGGNSTINQAKTINEWLENIANQISGFFNGAIGSINTLVSAISSFTGTLKSLYMWLPAPVYGLLTSAIMLAITIGVIKVFI